MTSLDDSPTRPHAFFEQLKFSDGTILDLGPNDVVVFVGPNNAGKSLALHNLAGLFGISGKGKVIIEAKTTVNGDFTALRNYLQKHARQSTLGIADRYIGLGFNLDDGQLASHLNPSLLHNLKGLFCSFMGTESRITFANSLQAINLMSTQPSHPIHLAFKDDRVAKRINTYFRRAFAQDLFPYYGGGSVHTLLVGQQPTSDPGEDRVSATYLAKAMAAASPIETQGDGMRSFASVVLAILGSEHQTILLLDEPEAFLHPPQARILGEYIAQGRPRQSQLFVATHSIDVLQGLMSVASDELRVVRLRRDGEINHVKELSNKRTKAVSADPLMQYTGVLSGVFHQRVIVCESDADCMFYSSLWNLIANRGDTQRDAMFIHAGGTARVGALASASRELGVQVDTIVDIDILRDEAVFEGLVQSVGGDWQTIETDVRTLKMAMNRPGFVGGSNS